MYRADKSLDTFHVPSGTFLHVIEYKFLVLYVFVLLY